MWTFKSRLLLNGLVRLVVSMWSGPEDTVTFVYSAFIGENNMLELWQTLDQTSYLEGDMQIDRLSNVCNITEYESHELVWLVTWFVKWLCQDQLDKPYTFTCITTHFNTSQKGRMQRTTMTKVCFCSSLLVLWQHLNSVHRWTVLQLDLQTLKDNPPTSQLNVSLSHTQQRGWEKMIENLLPWWQAQQYLIATACWESCI